MATFNTADHAVVEAVNRVLRTRMRVIGRAEEGTSGGAIFVDLGDGGSGVITTFLGTRARAEQTAQFVNHAHPRDCLSRSTFTSSTWGPRSIWSKSGLRASRRRRSLLP